MGKPLKAIPQVTIEDKKAGQVLDALKYVIDVREGRGTADQGKMWVTFDDLWEALKKIDVSGGSRDVLSEDFTASEELVAGCFVGIFKDTEDGDALKARKACGLVNEENQFKTCNGYVLKDYAAGATATVYYEGINTVYSGFGSLETGNVVYISDTAGEVNQTRKTGEKLQMVGMVVKSGILFVPGDVVSDCCVGSCSYYGEADESCSIMEKTTDTATDSSGLADNAFDKTFSTIDGAITRLTYLSLSIGNINALTSSEDPDCSEAFYIITSSYRAGIKRPVWEDVTAYASEVAPDEYNTNIGSLYRLRKWNDATSEHYSAREAVALIKKYVGENNNTIFSNMKIMGKAVFDSSDYAPLSETPFPDSDMAYLIVGTATVDMTETNFCVACSVEYCW